MPASPAKKTDLRVQRTRKVIKDTFREMVMEMDASKITVKELTEQAGIHRKTFYLHYTAIEALYEDILQDVSGAYYREIDKTPPDAPFHEVNEVFFRFLASQPPWVEKMVCDPSYRDFADRLFLAARLHNRARYNPYASYTREEQNIINTFLCIGSVNLYRQWVRDGKALPLSRLIALTDALFERGVSSIRKEAGT